MKLELQSRVTKAHLDFDMGVEFEDSSSVAFSEFELGGVLYDEDNQFDGLRALVGLLGRTCTRAKVSPSSVLELDFDDGSRVMAKPRDEVESWEYTAANGSTMICLPEGDIESMPRPFRHIPPAVTAGPPSEGATVVKISVGQDSGIEFSDRTVLRTDVPLDSAYLILRESVVSSHLIEKRQQIELSSGYFLPLDG
ncbi:MAG: DUF6188 family protein [Rhodococcus sp. (in: high G+C Gram-positive bacteria)]